jgi:hypothetical protein
VEEEGVRVLVVHEQQALPAAAQREVGQEVVVEPVAQAALVAVAEDVAPRDEHVGAEAGRHLERVLARRRDRPEAAEGVVAVAGEGLLGEEVESVALHRHHAGGAGSGGRDAADELAPRGGQLPA